MVQVQAINFKSSRDSDFNAEYDYTPEDVADEIPAELGLEDLPEGKKADFMKDFARLYTIKSRADTFWDAEKTHFEKGKNKNGEDVLFLMIEHMKPSDLSLAVSNGQVVLTSVEKMTPDQYQDLAKFCWINNFSEVSLPENADEIFKQMFQQAYENMDSQAVLGYGNREEDKQDLDEVDEEIRKERENLEETNTGEGTTDEVREQDDQKSSSNNDKKTSALDEIEKRMKTFMEIRSAKKKDSYYFKTHTWGGWLHYRIYESPEQRASDGVWDDKSKLFKSTYEIDLKFKNVNGQLEIRYAVPGTKPIPAKYADEIVGIMKSQGYTEIEFEDLTDEDKGTFIKSCGQAGMLPTFNLNATQAENMLRFAAEKKIAGLADYKKRMAKKLRKQIEKSGKPMEDKDNAQLRTVILKSEAENGIVTKGIVWTGADVAMALKLAQDNLSEEELYEFKKELAEDLKKQIEAENYSKNPLQKVWERLDNEVAYKPFVDAFDQIQGDIKDISLGIKTKPDGSKEITKEAAKAQEVIGALNSAGELEVMFKEAKKGDWTVREFIDSNMLNLAEEKKKFISLMHQKGEADWEKQKFCNLNSERLFDLYNIIKDENVHKADKDLYKVTMGKSEQDKNTIVNDRVKDAASKLKNTARTFDMASIWAIDQESTYKLEGAGDFCSFFSAALLDDLNYDTLAFGIVGFLFTIVQIQKGFFAVGDVDKAAASAIG